MLSHHKGNSCAGELPDLYQTLLEQEINLFLFPATEMLRLFVTTA